MGISDHDAMSLAIEAARSAELNGDVPVGAIILNGDGEVLATAFNRKEAAQEPTAHAELLAIRAVAGSIGAWRLENTTLVVTLEPCVMCAGAIVAARIPRVVFGAYDPKAGAAGSLYNLLVDPRLNHQSSVTSGVRADECGAMLQSFFAAKRKSATEL